MDLVFEKLLQEQIVRIRIEAFSLDSTSVKVHPDGTGALKKTDHSRSANRAADGPPRFIWLRGCSDRNNVCALPGNAHDAPEGRELLRDLGSFPGMPVIMDRAYEGNETRQLVLALEMVPVVPPISNRVDPWRYDRTLYQKTQ